MQGSRMVCLTEASGTFHARVIAARLGADGILTQLRGAVDGPYPMGSVYVYVEEHDLPEAKELLLADEVESAFDDDAGGGDGTRAHRRDLWLVAAAMLVLTALVVLRSAVGG